ncbi:MAG: radical SAM protein, partial [Cyanobacteria bacterium J06649_5]
MSTAYRTDVSATATHRHTPDRGLASQPHQLERIHLEVTNVCNFKCEFCPDAIMERKRGHMAFDLLEKALDEIAQHKLAKIVAFHLMGEPLIYPHIFEAIAAACDRHLNLHLTTNGSTFHIRPEHIPQLVASGIPKVTISLQTPDPETFIIRGAPPKLAPEQYFDGITQYVQANLADDRSNTRVHLKFLDTTPHPFLVPHKTMHVVEGDRTILSAVAAFVSSSSLEQPKLTHTGRFTDALTMLSQQTYDLVLLDLHLPDGEGIGLITQLKQQAPDTPIV